MRNIVKDSLKDGLIRFEDLVSNKYFYSLSNCIKVLEGSSHELQIKKWKKENDGNYKLVDDEPQKLDTISLSNFAKYSLKWGILNFYNSADNFNINNNSYSRDFTYAVEQIKQHIVPDINHPLLIKLYKMDDSEISSKEIHLILESIKIIESYIKAKKNIA